MGDMAGIEGCADSRDGDRFGHARRGSEDGSAAERMADQEARCTDLAPHEIRSRDQVIDVRRKIGVGELALAGAEAGEIEAQNGEAEPGQLLADARGRENVLRAGETVGKKSGRPGLARRQIEPCRQLLA